MGRKRGNAMYMQVSDGLPDPAFTARDHGDSESGEGALYVVPGSRLR